jgi:SAM-dependent methyltransferase
MTAPAARAVDTFDTSVYNLPATSFNIGQGNRMSAEFLLNDKYDQKGNIYYSGYRNEMLEYVPSQAKTVLDVGCSSGAFGKAIKERQQAEVWGVEPHKPACDAAARVLDRALCEPFTKSLLLPTGYFECVVFNDCLEHLPDPFGALEVVKGLLAEGGKLVLSVPNIRHFDSLWELVVGKEWRYKNSGVMDVTHLRFFTRRSIERTVRDLGYTVERCEGINPIPSRKFYLLNALTFGAIRDTLYQQTALAASLPRSPK